MALLTTSFFINFFCARFDCNYYRAYPRSLPLNLDISNSIDDQPARVDPIVFTKSGGVEGYFMKVVSGREIYAFEGIPYAEPPTGNLRFRDPVPKRPWSGIRNAKKYGLDCTQISITRYVNVVGQDDCLHLNIFSPQIPIDGVSPKLAVIIFIHGGNFYYGAGREYGPAYLLQEDVILVTFNYRVGVLGFLSTGDEESLGNWGLKDQSLAIKWVHENIERFGGSPHNITLTGQSAGGASVHFQMLSTTSMARGLFTQAASFSGSAFHHWALQTPQYAKYFTDRLAQIVGCPLNKGSKVLVECFRNTNGHILTAAQRNLHVTTLFPLMMFAPVIEPNVTGAFITDTAENYYKNDLVMKIPYLCTNAAEESAFLFFALDSISITNYYLRNWRALMPLLYDYARYTHTLNKTTETLGIAYFGKGKLYDNGLKMERKRFLEMGSDRYFTVPNRMALRNHCKIAPTYSYNYHFRSKSGVANTLNTDYRKFEATHGDDLASFFNCSMLFEPLKHGTMHFEISKFLVNLLANFAKTGEPLHTSEDRSLVKIWQPITDPNDLKFLDIGVDGVIDMVPESKEKAKKLRVWQDLDLF